VPEQYDRLAASHFNANMIGEANSFKLPSADPERS